MPEGSAILAAEEAAVAQLQGAGAEGYGDKYDVYVDDYSNYGDWYDCKDYS